MVVHEQAGVVDWRTTGLWVPDGELTDDALVSRGASLFDGTFTWPVMVLRKSALERNVATMAEYCARHGLAFAPHGKTTMAPVLFDAQLAAGAWGITVATANQLLAARRMGVRRILVANELLDHGALTWMARELDADPDLEVLFYVDSVQGVETAGSAFAAAGGTRPLSVLVEVGHDGGRTGVRTVAGAVDLARLVTQTPGLRLAGAAGYEGGLTSVDDARAFLETLREAASRMPFADGVRPVVSAGGSAYFDVVVEVLGREWPGPQPEVVLRSGAYVSHDDGVYRTKTPFNRVPDEGGLDAALEVWAQVTSTPEPGLAIVGLGKREAPYDEGLAVPRGVRRVGSAVVEPAPDGLVLARINDHHGYLDVPADMEPLVPGDLVRFGISHPCTAFDRWRVIAVLEDDDTVAGVVRTYF
ncbi:alanine racemase [Mumia sp. DW29H23]|uniref:alanine racemase n=1 Tax=Mumia sp. DW29H23 TaxID=3421241 RepID=UPI003D695F5F